jgi:hypothetical protein
MGVTLSFLIGLGALSWRFCYPVVGVWLFNSDKGLMSSLLTRVGPDGVLTYSFDEEVTLMPPVNEERMPPIIFGLKSGTWNSFKRVEMSLGIKLAPDEEFWEKRLVGW